MTEILESFQWGLARTYEDIKPFLLKQNYIYDLRIHDGCECDINLSTWRYDPDIYSWHTILNVIMMSLGQILHGFVYRE